MPQRLSVFILPTLLIRIGINILRIIREPHKLQHIQQIHLLRMKLLQKILLPPQIKHRLTDGKPREYLRPRFLIWHGKVLINKEIPPNHKIRVQRAHGFIKGVFEEPPFIAPGKVKVVKSGFAFGEVFDFQISVADAFGEVGEIHSREVFRPLCSLGGGGGGGGNSGGGSGEGDGFRRSLQFRFHAFNFGGDECFLRGKVGVSVADGFCGGGGCGYVKIVVGGAHCGD
mmetsp:Transcript_3294/g.4222  ORF Transcript_3294/g.4222 Transcript_3294/m.4222 type:complete len:228 (-) Transcript_3294:315-998(-)